MDADSPERPFLLEVVATDFAFEAPASVPAGWTTIRMVNRGMEPHHVSLVRLDEGPTLEDFFAAMESDDPTPSWAVGAGGPNGVGPNQRSEATLHLTPGRYALICFIPSPDGVPHVMKGMSTLLEVTGSDDGSGPSGAEDAPEAHVRMRLVDFAVALDRPVRAGTHTFHVTADARSSEPHEIVLARLAPGAEADDLVEWLSGHAGPPPAVFLGGMSALSPGESGYFTADLEPGRYVWVCPLRVGPDATPHHERGMFQPFTIEEPTEDAHAGHH